MNETDKIFYKRLESVKKTLPDCALLYFSGNEKALSIRTLSGYAYDIKSFFDFMFNRYWKYRMNDIKDASLIDLNIVDETNILNFMEYIKMRQGSPISDAAYKRKFAAIDSFFSFYHKNKLIEINPCANIDYPRYYPNEADKINAATLDIFLNALKKGEGISDCRQKSFLKGTRKRDTAIVMLLLENVKLSKILNLNINDIDFIQKTVVFAHKNGEINYKLSKNAMNALQEYVEQERRDIGNDALFLSRQGRRICAQSVEDMLKNYSKLCNLNISITPQVLNYYSRDRLSKIATIQNAFLS